MKFGIAFANTGPFAEANGAVEFARAAEAAGFESIWTVEHVIHPFRRSGRRQSAAGRW